jgi:hypothetical protein
MVYTHSRYKNRAPLDVQVDTPEAHIAADKATDAALPRLIKMAENPGPEIDAVATARRDIEKATASGDFNAQSDAYRRLAKAERAARPQASIDISHGDDDASTAFQKQIDALRQSEAIQKQRHQLAAKHGLTPNQSAFLEHNPSFPNHPDVAKRALMAAHAEGHAEDSDAFHASVHRHFHAEVGTIHPDHLVERGGMRPDDNPERADERPPPKPRQRQRQMDNDDDDLAGRGRFVSAPVSRDVPDGRSYGEREQSRGRVTLSIEQKDMARRLGQSDVEYARGLIEMRKRDEEFR